MVCLARLELSTSSMPSVIFHNALGGQRQSKPWVFLPAILRRMLTSRSWRTTNSSSPQGGSQWNGGQPHQTAGVSDNSSTDSECTILEASSVASDQDRFDTAYEAFRDLSAGLYDIDTTRYSRGVTSEDAPGVELADGEEKLRDLVHLPRNWPLARLTIPLGGLSKQIDRLLEGYCFQILATNREPDAHNGKVIQTATHLTWILAEYLADTIAWLMRSILDNATKILFDNDTEPLLTPGFWILPLYRELLNSARRNRPSAASERARGCTGLVKLICKENKEQRGKRKFHEGEPHPNDRGGFTQWFGSCSLINRSVPSIAYPKTYRSS